MKEYNARPETKLRKRRVQQEWRKTSNYDWRKYYYKAKLEKPETYLLKQARQRAKDKGLEFTLTLEDIKIPLVCPIMNEPLQYVKGAYSDYSPSIDRIDSSKGYTKDNIQIISSIANRMKWNSTNEQLIQFAKGILKNAHNL